MTPSRTLTSTGAVGATGAGLAAAVLAIALAGCAGATAPAPSTSTEPSADPAALLPDDIRERGTLTVAVSNSPYPPMVFPGEDSEMTGFDIALADAVGERLGLTPEYVAVDFDRIIPDVAAAKADLGVSALTDNPERQESVDFVDYLSAGLAWAAPVGADVDVDHACGLTIAVQKNSWPDADVVERSDACVAAGEPAIEVLRFDPQEDVIAAVVDGQADALIAESPVTLHAVDQRADVLALVGDTYYASLYGVAVDPAAKGLTEAVAAALAELFADGTYEKLLADWGFASGAVAEPTVNGGD